MKMSLRWFGDGFDTVTPEMIRQIPGVPGVVTTLYSKKPGELWLKDEMLSLKNHLDECGLDILGIESVNIHDDIKTGASNRDFYIENYIKTLEMLGKMGINLICYNFMPVFDWTRSSLDKMRSDGSTVLAYDQKEIDKIDPYTIFESMQKNADGFILPGWEPERLGKIKELFDQYRDITNEKLFDNLVYFLKAIGDVCKKYNIKMAIHPDDPAWPVFGLPRIINNKENILKLINAVDYDYNGVTLCSGSLGSNPKNDIPDIIRSLKDRIHFAHIRNIKYNGEFSFEESAHLSSDGSLDLCEILRTLKNVGFDGIIRPDHGRMILGEKAMPGYGFFDRALGAAYINGIWEAL